MAMNLNLPVAEMTTLSAVPAYLRFESLHFSGVQFLRRQGGAAASGKVDLNTRIDNLSLFSLGM